MAIGNSSLMLKAISFLTFMGIYLRNTYIQGIIYSPNCTKLHYLKKSWRSILPSAQARFKCRESSCNSTKFIKVVEDSHNAVLQFK